MPKKDLRQMKRAKEKLDKDMIREAAKSVNMDANVDELDNNEIHSVEDTIKKYEEKSEDELMGDLGHMISEGKKDGTFSDEMLEGFIKNVSPMMDETQRQKLKNIAQMIKMNKI